MHKFLRAIGFSDITKKDLEMILDEVITRPEIMKITKDSEGNEFAELSGSFAANAGITVRGTYQEDDSFHMDYYYPYVFGTSITTNEQIDVEKHAEKESYAGVCDEVNLGVTLIFYIQNVADYLAETNRNLSKIHYGAMLAGLSTEGKILCPVVERKKNDVPAIQKNDRHNQLIAQAREGDEDAIESLTLEDMDTYALLSQRVMKEDIFSIVKSTFMPFGIESHLHLPGIRLEVVLRASQLVGNKLTEVAERNVIPHSGLKMSENTRTNAYVPCNVRRFELCHFRNRLVAYVETELRPCLGINRSYRTKAQRVTHVDRYLYRVQVLGIRNRVLAIARFNVHAALAVLRRSVDSQAHDWNVEPNLRAHVPAGTVVGIEIFAIVERQFRHVHSGHETELKLRRSSCRAADDKQHRNGKEKLFHQIFNYDC